MPPLAIIQAHELDKDGYPKIGNDGKPIALDEPIRKPEKRYSVGERHYREVEVPRRERERLIREGHRKQQEEALLKLAEGR